MRIKNTFRGFRVRGGSPKKIEDNGFKPYYGTRGLEISCRPSEQSEVAYTLKKLCGVTRLTPVFNRG